MKLLFIDTDRDLVEMLTYWLRGRGFEVYRAYDEVRARKLWVERLPDLVIMDIRMSNLDAVAFCSEMRMQHDALVMMVSESKEIRDEIHYLSTIADAYLIKPFLPSQLLANIQAVSRRARASLKQQPSAVITIGPIEIDARHNEVTVRGKTSHLTPSESKLLHLLAVNVNDVCTTEKIVTHIWGHNGDGAAYLIKAHICHLRRKIERDATKPRYLLTIPGVGYKLVHYANDIQASQPLSLRLVEG